MELLVDMGWDRDDESSKVGVITPEPNLASTDLSLFLDCGKIPRGDLYDDKDISTNMVNMLKELLDCCESDR